MTFTSALLSSLIVLGATTRDRRDKRDDFAEARDAPILTTLRVLPQVSGAITAAGILQGTKGEMPTVTRSSAKYCTRSDGVQVSLATNVPCVELKGLLVEQASTNLCVRSQALASSPWLTQNGGPTPAAAAAVINNAAVAPDGTTTATSVDYPAVTQGSDISIIHTGTIAVSNGSPYTVSVWVKGASSSGTLYLALYDTQWNTLAIAFTTSWQRFTLTRTASNSNFDILFGVDRRDAAQGAQPAQMVYVWGFQLEAGTFATSYIATSGTAATRGPDRVTFSSSLVPVATGSMAVDFTPMYVPPANGYVLNTQASNGVSGTSIMLTSNGRIRFDTTLANGTNDQLDDIPNLTWTLGTTYRIRVKWISGSKKTYRDGVFNTSNTSTTMPDAANQLNVGTAYNGNAGYQGWFKNLCMSRSTEGCQ